MAPNAQHIAESIREHLGQLPPESEEAEPLGAALAALEGSAIEEDAANIDEAFWRIAREINAETNIRLDQLELKLRTLRDECPANDERRGLATFLLRAVDNLRATDPLAGDG